MAQTNFSRQIRVKVQEDTDKSLNKIRETQRKIKVQAEQGKKSDKKEVRADATPDFGSSVAYTSGGLGITLVLSLTLAIINDFSDLVLWQKMLLISQTLDITTLILVLLMIMFTTRSYFFSVFLVFFVFLLEILPVLGVLPLWTIGMAGWYLGNRR